MSTPPPVPPRPVVTGNYELRVAQALERIANAIERAVDAYVIYLRNK